MGESPDFRVLSLEKCCHSPVFTSGGTNLGFPTHREVLLIDVTTTSLQQNQTIQLPGLRNNNGAILWLGEMV